MTKPREYSNIHHQSVPMAYRVTRKLRQSCSNWRPPGTDGHALRGDSRRCHAHHGASGTLSPASTKKKLPNESVLGCWKTSKRRRGVILGRRVAAQLLSLVALILLGMLSSPRCCINTCAKAEDIIKTGKRKVAPFL